MTDVSLKARRTMLLERTDLHGRAFCQAYAAAADQWLSGLAEAASGGDPGHLALLAVGGYGRGALCPYSDLDVVLVHDGRRDVSTVADAIWYPVWDQGVRLDYSVRRPREVLAAAEDDLRVALGLLDARLIWGEARIAEPLLASVLDRWRDDLGAHWLPALSEQMAERHRSQGEVAFLVEPDVKESHGGLRDVNVLEAVATYAPLVADYVDLHSLERSAAVLTDVRVALHHHAGRALDRLLLQDQDQVAASLGYEDADALMAAVSSAGRQIVWVSDDAWRRIGLWQPQRRRRRRAASEPVSAMPVATAEPGIQITAGEIGFTPDAPVADDPSMAFRLTGMAAMYDLPISRRALHRLGDRMGMAPNPWPTSMRDSLVHTLSAGRPAIVALEALDHYGLFTRLLPEWATIRNRPQRNAFHRFTVDRHLLETAANAAALVERVERPDLLLIGALLHDIGKGSPGDHTAAGIELVSTIAARMGFPDADVAVLTDLVRHHLLLPDTATRRDLDDPSTIERVAGLVGNTSTLALLAAFTEADSLATGPSAWGPWKAGLVADLVARTDRALRGEIPASWRPGALPDHEAMARESGRSGRPLVTVDPPRIMVAAPDRPGFLASVAGVLALHDLDVRSADAGSSAGEGGVVDVFTVEPVHDRWPDQHRLQTDLDAVLAGRLVLTERLAEKARAYAGRNRATRAAPIVPSVEVDNHASATSTVLEVRAVDEIGLLHRVTQALFDTGLDVVSARASTFGPEAIDAFYVRDRAGHKLVDPEALSRVVNRLHRAIDQSSSGGDTHQLVIER